MSFYHTNCSYDPTDAIGNEPERYPGEPGWQTNEEEYDWRAWRNTVVMSEPPEHEYEDYPNTPYESISVALENRK
jgi:hypothetical protein